MIEFAKWLATLVFTAPLPSLPDVPWQVDLLVVLGLVIMCGMPRIAPFATALSVWFIVMTVLVALLAITLPHLGDHGESRESLPSLLWLGVALTLETLGSILPFSIAVATVRFLESLLTMKLVDDIPDTPSAKTREAYGQGAASILSEFLGGMGGCAMIGQAMINVKASEARTRFSTFFAGVFVLVLVVALGEFVAMIPTAARVAGVTVAVIATFNGHNIGLNALRRVPKSETIVMLAIDVAVARTHNLAIGMTLAVAVVIFRGDATLRHRRSNGARRTRRAHGRGALSRETVTTQLPCGLRTKERAPVRSPLSVYWSLTCTHEIHLKSRHDFSLVQCAVRSRHQTESRPSGFGRASVRSNGT